MSVYVDIHVYVCIYIYVVPAWSDSCRASAKPGSATVGTTFLEGLHKGAWMTS